MRIPWYLVVLLVIPASAKAATCDAMVADIVEKAGAHFNHYSPSGQNAFFDVPSIGFHLHLSYGQIPQLVSVDGSWNQNAFPPNQFFKTLAAARTVVTSETASKLEGAIRKCYKAALADTSELSSLDVGTAHIEYQAFTRDGGGVEMSIFHQ